VAIVERVKKFYDDDNQDRKGTEIDARLQRYAKYRMWTEQKDWPWEDATELRHAGPDDGLHAPAGHAAQRRDVAAGRRDGEGDEEARHRERGVVDT
jgi:hypothetical protein